MSFFSVSANFFCSWISDKIRLKWLLLAMMLAQIIGLFGLMNFGTFWGRAVFTVAQGSSGGMFFAISTVVFPRYFGRKHLGAISGLSLSVMVFASAIGPVLFSGVHSLTGSYKSIILGSIVLPSSILLASLKANNPQKTSR
jgi:MFS family permease